MTLYGLTPFQVSVADKLWAQKSIESYRKCLRSLDEDELAVAMVIEELAFISNSDQVEDVSVAKLMLQMIGVPL